MGEMTFKLGVATFAGGFIFPFMIRILWGKMVDNWGPIGGWMAAGFIVGTAWTLTHGVSMIHQTGTAWIDMAWAAGFGLMAASAISGDCLKKCIPSFVYSIVGGVLGGFILSCFM
ncbi:MAG: hypothetical protein N4A54_05130 [Peptostreptococcaceae bacterium]|jgi:hypothetical protein|nr:hypothetical protein [Peptostreptococcaceae bacterium]